MPTRRCCSTWARRPRTGDFLRALEPLELAPLRCAVLSHWHWDHSFGGAALAVPIAAHRLTADELAREAALDFGDDALDARVARGEELAFCAWKLLLAIGVLIELTGVFSILVPIVASISVAILAGWALLVGGVVQFGHMLRSGAGWDRIWRLFLAAITAIAGLSLLLFPLSGTITITFVLVVWFFLSGGTKLAAWWRTRQIEGSWMLGLNGAASVVLGALIWANLPSSAAWAIGLLVGIELILYGMS